MKKALFALMILIPGAERAYSAELTPFLSDKKLGVLLRDLKLPETLSRDLASGLTNKFLVRVELAAGSEIVTRKIIEINVRYDLWTEKFLLTRGGDGGDISPKSYSDRKDILMMLKKLRLPDLIPVTDLPALADLTLKADALINPVEKEKMEKIKKWVAQNSISTPVTTAGTGAVKPVGGLGHESLFNKIFEQFADGATVAAIWRETVSSKPFRLRDVIREK